MNSPSDENNKKTPIVDFVTHPVTKVFLAPIFATASAVSVGSAFAFMYGINAFDKIEELGDKLPLLLGGFYLSAMLLSATMLFVSRLSQKEPSILDEPLQKTPDVK